MTINNTMQAAYKMQSDNFPPESDLPPPNDEELPPPPPPQVVGLKPVMAFGFAGGMAQKPQPNNDKITGFFGGQQPATGCIFPRPATSGIPFNPEQKIGCGLLGGIKKDDTNINALIYAQLSTMRTQINQLNSGIDKIYELLAKNN
jgi:hypothetical protein